MKREGGCLNLSLQNFVSIGFCTYRRRHPAATKLNKRRVFDFLPTQHNIFAEKNIYKIFKEGFRNVLDQKLPAAVRQLRLHIKI